MFSMHMLDGDACLGGVFSTCSTVCVANIEMYIIVIYVMNSCFLILFLEIILILYMWFELMLFISDFTIGHYHWPQCCCDWVWLGWEEWR